MIAVITGDLVRSSQLSAAQINQAERTVHRLTQEYGETGCRSEWFRGDGFQLVAPAPERTVEILVRLVCQLTEQGLSATLSVGLGEGEIAARPGLSQGRVFELSGRGLEQNARGELSLHIDAPELNQQVQLPTAFLSFLLARLTARQAQVIDEWIAHGFCEHQQVADRLDMTRQNVSLHLRKAGAALIERYDETFGQWLLALQQHTPKKGERQ